MRQEVAQKLDVHLEGYVDLGVNGFRASYSKDRYGLATIGIVTSDGIKRVPLLITEDVVSPISQRGWKECLKLPYIQGLELADDFLDENFIVDILIGGDYCWHFFKGECVRGDGPTAHMSNVGALLIGSLRNDQPGIATDSIVSNCCITESVCVDSPVGLSNAELDNKLSTLFRCSELGAGDVTSNVDDVDEVFKSKYRDQIVYRAGKWYVPLPWREDHKELQSNLQLCWRFLEQVVSRLKRENLLEPYCKVLQEHFDVGYAEEVKDDPWDETHSHVLPHFFVLRDSETTPLR
ncbi:MAG: hypothetical protein MJA29_03230, partial [Candidatus Omnitrophica bacterium]|nr:hypothetical protein [Candidatus Omnitrophota bacterium]